MARLFSSHNGSGSLALLLMTVLVAVALGSSSSMHTHTHTSTYMGFHHLPLKREAWGAAGRGVGVTNEKEQQRVRVGVGGVERHNALHNYQEKRRITLPMLPSPLGLVWNGILYSRRRNGAPAPPAATRLQPLVSMKSERETGRERGINIYICIHDEVYVC